MMIKMYRLCLSYVIISYYFFLIGSLGLIKRTRLPYHKLTKEERIEVLSETLATYKSLYGDILVPLKWKVPNNPIYPKDIWGFKLGRCVKNIRVGLSPGFYDRFTDLGYTFEPVVQDSRSFDSIISLLTTYYNVFGNLQVPAKWKVPAEDPWPKDMYGARLGSTLRQISSGLLFNNPEFRGKLVNLGVNITEQRAATIQTVCKCLTIYRKLNPNSTHIPINFNIPHEKPWPKNAYGLPFGVIYSNIQHGIIFSDSKSRSRLQSVGFNWSRKRELKYTFQQLLEALTIYKGIYGNLKVPQMFSIPKDNNGSSNNPWPEYLHGMKLGMHVNVIRRGSGYKTEEYRDALTNIGFVWEKQLKRLPFEIILKALKRYKEIYGNLRVHLDFKVPEQSDLWPEETWGMPLGNRVNELRNKNAYTEYSAKLKEIGFSWNQRYIDQIL